ncbi:nitroreductase family protein [Limisalsivibrio acetivorans]|uniref:nitroreductase family protein n=1 Tax=Limisalsivibrio acetivorans TaxID=1304888 RepID=UPI0003B4C260|nr:nitroreductase family protein [Limisalsivibrio acetivorans]
MLKFTVNKDTCTRCGNCMRVCPAGIVVGDEENFPKVEKEENCIECQHCMTSCPVAAISIFGLDPEESVSIDKIPSYEQMDALVRGRRSIRKFRQDNVNQDELRMLLETVANAPTGVNKRKVRLTLIDDIEKMAHFIEFVYSTIEKYAEEKKIPEQFAILEKLAEAYRKGKDIIFRGAPHFVFTSSPKNVPTPEADSYIAASYFDLTAPTMDIGTVWAGFIMHCMEFMPEVREYLGVPEDHVNGYALLFGKPALKYYRGVQRDEIDINKL